MLERLLKGFTGLSEPAFAGLWMAAAGGIAAAAPPRLRLVYERASVEVAPRGVTVGLASWSEMAGRVTEWNDLFSRALEPHVFMTPGFALHAAQHSPPAQRPIFLTISETFGDASRLIGLLPFAAMPGSFGRVVRLWRPDMTPVGTPLFDRERAEAAVDAMLDWFARTVPQIDAIMLSLVSENGPTAEAFRRSAAARDLPTRGFERHERAYLMGGNDPEQILRTAISGPRMKKYRRQRRRLAELGTLETTVAATLDSCRETFEQFLALEAGGWKGRRGTALLRNAGLSTFARTMVRSLAQSGQCRIHALRLDGKVIAACIVLASGSHSYLWKIAYDEAYADYSPGTLLMLDISHAQLADPAIVATDSCTDSENQMINRLWPHRVAFFDMAIAIRPSSLGSAEAYMRRETLRRRIRSTAKNVYLRLFRR